MIKIFRKIRQNLISEGTTGQYLKYAIGEIALLVIGILLALQLNNWNENGKSYNKARNYLFEIITDLQKDTSNFNHPIEILNNLIANEEWVLNPAEYTHRDANRLFKRLAYGL